MDERWLTLQRQINRGDITSGADAQGWTVLHHAVWRDSPVTYAKLIIDKLRISPNLGDARGNTSMHDAAFQDVSPELLNYLLDVKGDPNQPNRFGETAVYEASYRAQPRLMHILLTRGGNPNAVTMQGETPLMASVRANADPEVVALLLRHGAKTRARDKSGKTAHRHAHEADNDFAVRFIEKVEVMQALISGKIRKRSSNNLRCVPIDLLRRMSDYL